MTDSSRAEGPDTRLVDAVKLRNAMKQLLATEGWKMYAATVNNQRESIANSLLNKVITPNETLAQEMDKGQVIGMWKALQLPQTLLEQAEAVIEGLQDKEEADAA